MAYKVKCSTFCYQYLNEHFSIVEWLHSSIDIHIGPCRAVDVAIGVYLQASPLFPSPEKENLWLKSLPAFSGKWWKEAVSIEQN